MEQEQRTDELILRKKNGGMRTAKVYNRVFFWTIAVLPLAMLAFSWLCINLNSILLAFKTFDEYGQESWAGLYNIKEVISDYVSDPLTTLMFRNSAVFYLVALIVTSIVPIIFSFYVFKRMWGHGFFKVVMFMPRIVAGICTVTIYKFLVERVIPSLFNLEQGLLENQDTAFWTITFYSLWLSFGGGLLTQVGAMNATEQSTIDAGQIDGVGFFGEFWHIVFPRSYRVILIGFYTGFPALFTNDLGLYAFMGDGAPSHVSTVGYQYQVKMQRMAGSNSMMDYTYWSAWGLLCSAICIPVTFLLRYLVEHIGPSEE